MLATEFWNHILRALVRRPVRMLAWSRPHDSTAAVSDVEDSVGHDAQRWFQLNTDKTYLTVFWPSKAMSFRKINCRWDSSNWHPDAFHSGILWFHIFPIFSQMKMGLPLVSTLACWCWINTILVPVLTIWSTGAKRGIVINGASLLGCWIPVSLQIKSFPVFKVSHGLLFLFVNIPRLLFRLFLSLSPQVSYFWSFIFLELFTSYDLLSFTFDLFYYNWPSTLLTSSLLLAMLFHYWSSEGICSLNFFNLILLSLNFISFTCLKTFFYIIIVSKMYVSWASICFLNAKYFPVSVTCG